VLIEPHEQDSKFDDKIGIKHAKWYFWAVFGIFLIVNFVYCFAHYNSMNPLWTFIQAIQMLYLYMSLDCFYPSQL